MFEQLAQVWQHLPGNIDPVLLSLGPVQIRYYGLMYVISFLVVYFLAIKKAKATKAFTATLVEDYFFWIILGIVIGARIGYILFYDFAHLITNPLAVFIPFDFSNGIRFTGISGLSFHGGVIGFIITTAIYCRKKHVSFFGFNDFLVPLIPLGYMFGRIGNFLNHELYGRVTDAPWGMYFPTAPTYALRHPSQLYEAFFEGLVLFWLLSWLSKKESPAGVVASWYLIGYGVVRFFIEYFRQPDEHIGLLFLSLSMGQILCVAMVVVGGALWQIRLKRG